MTTRLLLALCALAACETTGGDAGSGGAAGTTLAESGTRRGSAGGFSATLAKELGPPEGSLGAAAPGASTTPGKPAATGSASNGAGSAGGSATAAIGDAASAGGAAGTAAAASADTSTAGAGGAASPGDTGTATASTGGAAGTTAPGIASGTGATVQTMAGKLSAASPPPGQNVAPATSGRAGAVAAPAANRVHVKPSAELAAIKFDLEPNWERDVGEAGTFSLVVKLPNGEQRVFAVRYGYEDPAAPFDCDQYRKFLDENKVMTVTLNRQRGAACYIEGTEKTGIASYRYLVNFGGKRLVCSGSLYKDSASSSLGDLRDKVLMQAKKICETLAL